MKSNIISLFRGSGVGACGRAVAACPNYPSSNMLGAGLLSRSFNQRCVLNQVPRGGVTLTDFQK